MTELFLALAILLQPLVWAVLALARPALMGLWGLMLGIGLNGALAMALTLELLARGGAVWLAPGFPGDLGVGLRIDGIAVLFILLTSVIASCSVFQAHWYFRDRPGLRRWLWPMLMVLWTGMNLIWLANDLLLIYLGMEVVAFCVVGLIALNGEAQPIRAAMRYLQAVLLGTLALLLGAGVLLADQGTLALAIPGESRQPTVLLGVASALITAGLIYRAALFPLHSWLPPAHGSAHAPLSALLSALVTKASFYILARYWLANESLFASELMGAFIGVLASVAILWGGWMAWRQVKLKMLLAYSSVNQVGYFFLMFPLVAGVSPDVAELARQGALLQVVSHALAKAALFMAVGNLVMAIGSERVEGLAGVSRFLPVSLLSFGLAGVSVMGLPPSGGFLAKWTLLQASLSAGQWWWIIVLLLGGLLSAAYIFRVFRQTYLEGPGEDDFHYGTPWLELAPMLLALLAVSLGLLAAMPLALLDIEVEP